jgi:hypothetical protein
LFKWLAAEVEVLVEELVVGALVGLVAILLSEAILQTVVAVALYRITAVVVVEVSLLALEQDMELLEVQQVMEV